MGTWTVAPFAFSRVMRLHVDLYLLRYTDMTLPSRFLNVPRTTVISSSLRMGIERTLYLTWSSFERDADMITRLSLEGAEKWSLAALASGGRNIAGELHDCIQIYCNLIWQCYLFYLFALL